MWAWTSRRRRWHDAHDERPDPTLMDMATSVDPRPQSSREPPEAYAELVDRFTRRVRRAVPPGATVAVVSKGDQKLLNIEGRQAWHFPQRADGVYAGYYPPDDASAIDHLETIRKKGADFLALPP